MMLMVADSPYDFDFHGATAHEIWRDNKAQEMPAQGVLGKRRGLVSQWLPTNKISRRLSTHMTFMAVSWRLATPLTAAASMMHAFFGWQRL